MKHEEVGIAGDDQVGSAVDRKIKEFVVRRIPARADQFIDLHEPRRQVDEA